MNLPNVNEIRSRIDSVPWRDIRCCLRTCYLFAGRISEVVGKASYGDTTTARGPRGVDADLDIYTLGEGKEQAVVFTVKTAKRGGRERKVALPLNYEPWVKEVYDYFQQRGSELVFPFTRQKVWAYAKEVFDGLTYPIEKYVLTKKDLGLRKVIDEHLRPFRLHALRHLRASELVEFYGFDGFNLATYGGWTYHTMTRVSTVMERYLSLGWQSYFPKLLKERRG